MERLSSDDLDGQGQKRSTSSKPTGNAYTAHPERDLQAGDPNLVGGAPPEPKKTMAEKVKGLFKGHHRDDEEDKDSAVGSGVGHTPEASPYGTVDTGNNLSGNAVDSTAPGKEESDVQPQGETGSDALTDHQGNLKPGPHTDSVKRDTVFSKIKDKLHGSK